MKKFTKLVLTVGLFSTLNEYSFASKDLSFSFQTMDGHRDESVVVCSPAAFEETLPKGYKELQELPVAHPGITLLDDLCLFTPEGQAQPAFTELLGNTYSISNKNSAAIREMESYRNEALESHFYAPMEAPYLIIPKLKDGVGLRIMTTANKQKEIGVMHVTQSSFTFQEKYYGRSITKLEEFLGHFSALKTDEHTVVLTAETMSSLLLRTYEQLKRHGFIHIRGNFDRQVFTRSVDALRKETFISYPHLNFSEEGMYRLTRRVSLMTKHKTGHDQIDQYLAALVSLAKTSKRNTYWPNDPFIRPKNMIVSLQSGDVTTADRLVHIIAVLSQHKRGVTFMMPCVTKDLKLKDTIDIRALRLAELRQYLDVKRHYDLSFEVEKRSAVVKYTESIRTQFPILTAKL